MKILIPFFLAAGLLLALWYKIDQDKWLQVDDIQHDQFVIPKQQYDELSDEVPEVELNLGPKDFLVNFFGFLRAGEYENVATFFDPEIMMEYFYQNKSADGYYQKVKEFGDRLSRNQTLEDVKILSMDKEINGRFWITVEIKYKDATLQKKILIEERNTDERHKETFILTHPKDLITE